MKPITLSLGEAIREMLSFRLALCAKWTESAGYWGPSNQEASVLRRDLDALSWRPGASVTYEDVIRAYRADALEWAKARNIQIAAEL